MASSVATELIPSLNGIG